MIKKLARKFLTVSQTVEGTDADFSLFAASHSFCLPWSQVSTVVFLATCPRMVTLGESLSLTRRKPIRLLEGRGREMQGVYPLLPSPSAPHFSRWWNISSPVSAERQPIFYGCSSNHIRSLFSHHTSPSTSPRLFRASSPQGLIPPIPAFLIGCPNLPRTLSSIPSLKSLHFIYILIKIRRGTWGAGILTNMGFLSSLFGNT